MLCNEFCVPCSLGNVCINKGVGRNRQHWVGGMSPEAAGFRDAACKAHYCASPFLEEKGSCLLVVDLPKLVLFGQELKYALSVAISSLVSS